MKIKLTKRKFIGTDKEPYIIAEIGANHNGDMRLAKKLIVSAKKSGANCVKFQSFSTKNLFSAKSYQLNPKLKDEVSKYAISNFDLIKMKAYAEKLNLDFAVTAFSKEGADFLVEKLNVDFIKVASMDLNNLDFLEYISKKKKPIVLSTGLSNSSEIKEAVKTIKKAGNKRIVLLHCISSYPPRDNEINLNNIDSLSKTYPYPVGFSDHTIGTSISLAAIAKGACIIEKHFTLDKTMEGWDHKISADEKDMKILTKESKKVFIALGSYKRTRTEDKNTLGLFRRSIVAAKNIKKGEVFTEELIDVKRPGTGLSPSSKKILIGKIAKRNISYDEIIDFDDF